MSKKPFIMKFEETIEPVEIKGKYNFQLQIFEYEITPESKLKNLAITTITQICEDTDTD